ncbi:ABC transporter substrate-binding protein [Pelagovum pacificum]|uniref:Sugar ABC transporter substrate-binding protein n=1 Tax=Pelagovum pacificum TaxID=2588711 RepID=A0A5C5GHF0_9RHOB|nr:sugar ABC transporter substrate-binding protein [Pelagovum pacificum]QQA43515.1 sugar ABC transporter substrate-binding protein [Pelagovum pacificum]TNY33349.1 sugar ABC transporter substrate-binding protein [Pelagovum pacificum]
MSQAKRIALLTGASVLSVAAMSAQADEVTWWTPNFNEERARELVAQFEEEHPEITVNLEITVTNGLPERILTTLRSGSAPDLIDVQHPWVNGYAQNDLVMPLDDVLTDAEDYNEAAIDYVTWNDQLWAVPYRIEAMAVIFNKGDFEAAGLDPEAPPETWAELAEAAQALTGDGKFGFAITGGGEVGNTIFRSVPFVWMNGGDLISEDGTEAIINSPEAVEAVKYWTDMYVDLGVSPTSTLENDGTANRRLFIADTVSMYQSGQFDLASIAQENPDIDIGVMMQPHPEGKDPASILGGWSWVIPADAENPDEAKVLIEWLAQAENMGFYTDTFPARVSAMDMPRFDDPMLEVYGDMLPYGRPLPNHPNWVQISQAYFDGIQRILIGEMDAQESMDLAAEDIQALLD